MPDDANTPVDTSNTIVDPYSDPIWSELAVFPNTYRFDATDAGGNAVVYYVEAADQASALALYLTQPGADQNPTISAYTPTNLELQNDWAAGGFTMLSAT
jgi:hypothetical protein